MICLLSSTERVRFSQGFGALQRVGELWPLRSGNRAFTATRLGLHELDIESEGDLVANENAASLEGSVPGQSEVLTIDLCGRRDRNSGVAPRILRRWCGPFNVEADFVGYATNGQIAFDR